MRAHVNGIDIEYEVHGDPKDPVLLLVMGLGQQLIAWPEDLVQRFVDDGFRVVRYDNRDTGLSTKFDEAAIQGVMQSFMRQRLGMSVPAPYLLDDMEADAWGLLDHLDVQKADIVGVSMGGMIVQLMAGRRPERIRSVTSIMSTSGESHLPMARPEALSLFARKRPAGGNRAHLIEYGMTAKRTLAGPEYPTSEAEMRASSGRAVDRMWYPPGYGRHSLAVLASGDRRALLEQMTVPMLVVHGSADILVRLEHGQRVAELVPGARLEVIDGWGHDLAPGVRPMIAKWVTAHARAAS